MAAWNATVSASSCVRRRISTGVRSPPPPNHHLEVTTMRVFMCAAGTFGLTRMHDQRHAGRPEARVLVGAGDLAAELRRELAMHGRGVNAGLLEHAAVQQAHDAAAARRAGVVRPASRACAGSGRAAGRPAARPPADRPRAPRTRRTGRRAASRTRRSPPVSAALSSSASLLPRASCSSSACPPGRCSRVMHWPCSTRPGTLIHATVPDAIQRIAPRRPI